MKHFQILVIGGGNAGLSVSSHLLLKNRNLKIAIVEPREKHYYQPAWTLVGAGAYDINKTVRNESDLIPEKCEWVKDRCVYFHPDENKITLGSGEQISYDYLIICPGIQLNWDEIKGLKETIGKNCVCSNYSFETVSYTYECLKNFKGGKVIFHNPHTPIKCGGAPHKIMYLAADYFRKKGILKDCNIEYWSASTRLFGVEKFEKTLMKVVSRANIKLHFYQKLVEINGDEKKARFIGIGEKNNNVESWVDFDMIHITPPQSAPDFIRNSPVSNVEGWVDVDKNTLQHNKWKNIFSLGDASSLPTARTGAAIRKQVPVLASNLLSLMNNEPLTAKYNGYSSCPIVTGYGKLVLAEFDYDNHPAETLPFDQSKERRSMWLLKKYILPFMYWNFILKGKFQG